MGMTATSWNSSTAKAPFRLGLIQAFSFRVCRTMAVEDIEASSGQSGLPGEPENRPAPKN